MSSEFPPVTMEELMEYFESPSCAGTSVKTLLSLPKKINGKICPVNKVAWGLHAHENPSLFKVLCLIILPSTVFIICWLCLHPGDLQGAIALPTFIFGLFSISFFGLQKSGAH